MSFKPRSDRPPIVIHIPDRTAETAANGDSQQNRPRQKPWAPDPASEMLRMRVIGWLVALTTAGVLFCGLFPFDFVFRFATASDDFHRRFDLTINQLYTANDGLENIIFFTPTGFALALLLIGSKRQVKNKWLHAVRGALVALLLGAALSTFVECSQVFLQSRDPSLADICSNSVGTVVGIVLYLAIGNSLFNAVLPLVTRVDQWLTGGRSIAISMIWLLLALLVPLFALNPGSIKDWKSAYPLMLGNETTGDRWWNGTVSGLWIGDHALNDAELDRVLNGGDARSILGPSLQAEYIMTGRGPYPDSAGKAGPLHWIAGKPPETSSTADQSPSTTQPTTVPVDPIPPLLAAMTDPTGAFLSQGWWLRSADGAMTPVNNRISAGEAFTVIVDAQTDDLGQHDGPPRIVSISDGTTRCNLQLIQETDELIVRLRTSASGEGGSDPQFIVPYAFIDSAPRRIVVTYDRGELMATTDHIGERYRFRFAPESTLIWKAYPRPGWGFRMDSSGKSTCADLYRILAMAPFGYFLILRSKNYSAVRPTIKNLCLAITSAVALLEIALLLESGHAPAIITPIFAWLAAACGMIVGGWDFSPFCSCGKELPCGNLGNVE